MKEIGIKLKETRESMGISIDEAASDLKVKEIQIENKVIWMLLKMFFI